MYNAKTGSKESKGPFGLMETVREKIDTVRGRRRGSKEPSDRHEQVRCCSAVRIRAQIPSLIVRGKTLNILWKSPSPCYLLREYPTAKARNPGQVMVQLGLDYVEKLSHRWNVFKSRTTYSDTRELERSWILWIVRFPYGEESRRKLKSSGYLCSRT